ncbi:hypothetical protein M5K25_023957 [Dendrobium thyrsiflorum]|uniref:Uncharacterized protein n=1 Tax=Dendrobium thyrsiflorum TaxID=117978 RepID=A0ABD0U112_DENTH
MLREWDKLGGARGGLWMNMDAANERGNGKARGGFGGSEWVPQPARIHVCFDRRRAIITVGPFSYRVYPFYEPLDIWIPIA